jgi:hypothetical protein
MEAMMQAIIIRLVLFTSTIFLDGLKFFKAIAKIKPRLFAK